MKFQALALDYDGTIARDGVLDPNVRAAIAEVRTRGIAVVIVTGRILSDLQHVLPSLDLVDAVVAENGAVLEFPNRYSRLIGPTPNAEFLEELGRRGIQFTAGQCVVESDAASAPAILAVIRELELPLIILFNRGRLMVLPQGVSKSAGLHQALSTLHLSVHNTVAIGDAQNDHDLLGACELGVAVGWGSPALMKMADQVLAGSDPGALATYIRRMGQQLRLPPGQIGRHRLALGTGEDGRVVGLAIRGRNLLVTGDPGSGKSWVAGLTCEELILQGYCICVIDPEGDYRTLESLPGVVAFGGDDPPPQLPDLARALRHPEMSAVIDLCHLSYNEKIDYLHSLLPMLASLRRSTGLPHRIVVDEAHYFLHDQHAQELLDLTLNAYTLVTYRVADLDRVLRQGIEAIIANRITYPREVRTLMAMTNSQGAASEWEESLRNLKRNQAALLPGTEEAEGHLRTFVLAPRLTSHVRHKAKYLDVQLIQEQGFVFTRDARPVGPSARNLKQFVSLLSTCPPAAIEGHVHRGDFSRWIADVFHDSTLAAIVSKAEGHYRRGHTRELIDCLATSIQGRYDCSSEKLPSNFDLTATSCG